MIAVQHISKSFLGKEVLHDINTTFQPGQCSLIIGASGSGKTVLLKTIVGLHSPDSGDVIFDQVVFNRLKLSEQKKIRQRRGMLCQGSALFDFATVEENIRFPLDFFTKRVHLENAHKKYPAELSGGMQKRVGIARAIALNPQYLFCDEPNSGLDPLTAIHIDELIAEITQEYNITTIINTHDMNSVLEIGDQISFIHQGRIKWEGSRREIFHTNCPELNEFVFTSNLAKQLKTKTDIQL